MAEYWNWNRSSAASLPMSLRWMESDSPRFEETRGNGEREEKQRGPESVNKSMAEMPKFSWTTEKKSEENIPNSRPGD